MRTEEKTEDWNGRYREDPTAAKRAGDNARRWTPADDISETIKTCCAADLEGKRVPERKWLVEGVIPHENVTLLSGDGGLGKTILALMLGASQSTRGPWLGFNTMQGPFLYIGAEDDEPELHRRLDQMRVELGCSWGDLADFHFKSFAGEDALIATFDRSTQIIEPTALLQGIENRICELGAVACALDTSADMFGGDEISRTQVRQFVGMLRGVCTRCKVSIILLAHPSLSGMASGSGTSGSTAWHNSVRSRLYLKEDGEARLLEFKKSNYGPKGQPMRLSQRPLHSRRREGDGVSSDQCGDKVPANARSLQRGGASRQRVTFQHVRADDLLARSGLQGLLEAAPAGGDEQPVHQAANYR